MSVVMLSCTNPPKGSPVAAARYLRASTEHQQYSTMNQNQAIAQYAIDHNLQVVQTYVDEARSGLGLKHRLGLRRLLQDVVAGSAPYKAILVYDVSRWGRFLDTDESAHCEFLCKSAGVPVHYCVEIFGNDFRAHFRPCSRILTIGVQHDVR